MQRNTRASETWPSSRFQRSSDVATQADRHMNVNAQRETDQNGSTRLPGSGAEPSRVVQAASDDLVGHFSPQERCGSAESSSSPDSMHGGQHNLTPESDSSESEDGSNSRGSSPVAANLRGLRLKTQTPPARDPQTYDDGTLHQGNLQQGSVKRTAPEELPDAPCKKSPACGQRFYPNYGKRSQAPMRRPVISNSHALKTAALQKTARGSADSYRAPSLPHGFHDSAYESMDRPKVQQAAPAVKQALTNIARQYAEPMSDPNLMNLQRKGLLAQPTSKDRWDIRSQPESSPISQEQLAAEVKGIYAGLVMVEAKCINIDGQKAANPDERLGAEQWQALIALHRTLLYEHHDFLMATQHPSANAALRGLASKYCMPARMWKHGIHAFLEVLRHRRPESQEYMLAFIYLAYQMMALLYETVSGFTDTWIECLGDLARYRMAIEEDKEAHATWGGVAGRWYTMASDRHPAVGRLYHHLGILQRPSLCKFYYYARSLTSVIPFLNAKESLATLCAPILNDEQALRNGSHSAEAMSICYHARVFSNQPKKLVERDGQAALDLLEQQPSSKIAAYGVYLAVTNIAAILGFGPAENSYRQLFDQALNQEIQASRSAPPTTHPLKSKYTLTTSLDLTNATLPLEFTFTFLYTCFNTIIRRQPNRDTIQDLLPFVHVMLVYIASIHTLRSRLAFNDPNRNMLDHLVNNSRLDWSALARFLNTVATYSPLTSRIELLARQGMFPAGSSPLHEDYLIRGLVWAQWYFAPDWFQGLEDDDGSRSLENPMRQTARAERTLWLGLRLAMQSECLRYDQFKKHFSASAEGIAAPKETAVASPKSTSARSSVGGDFVMVSKPSPSPPREQPRATQASKTYASIVSGPAAGNEATASPRLSQQQPSTRKVSRTEASVKVRGEDVMDE